MVICSTIANLPTTWKPTAVGAGMRVIELNTTPGHFAPRQKLRLTRT